MAAVTRDPPWASTWRPAGVVARAADVLPLIWPRKTAPNPAMPVAIPTWRKVLAEPEDMPLRSGGTTDTVTEASTGLVIPTPIPATTKPGRSTGHVESAGPWSRGPQPGVTRATHHPARTAARRVGKECRSRW